MTETGKIIAEVIGGLFILGSISKIIETTSMRVGLEARYIYITLFIWIIDGIGIYYAITNHYIKNPNYIIIGIFSLLSPVIIIYFSYFLWKLFKISFLYLFKFMKWSLQGLDDLERKIDKNR